MLDLETVELINSEGIPFGDFTYYPDNRSKHEREAGADIGREAFVFTHYPSVIHPDYVPLEVSAGTVDMVCEIFNPTRKEIQTHEPA